jgi:hypothetical protein
MENAFHLGVWVVAFIATLHLVSRAVSADPEGGAPRAVKIMGWVVGVIGAILYATRPESVVCVAAFGIFAAWHVRRSFGSRPAAMTLASVAVPGVLFCGVQAIANRIFTGEWVANGAIAKLSLNNPYMTRLEKWDEYVFLLKYVVLRNTQHHFADVVPWGWLLPCVALVPLFDRRVRGVAGLLWAQVVGWLLLVALNGQVRWQNERYTMAAVAWLLVLAALGLAVMVRPIVDHLESRRAGSPVRATALAIVPLVLAVSSVIAYGVHQAPNLRDQIWFFGRASRNIRDQHIVAGKIIAALGPRRLLVGDAGALIYASDRPGLDLIGLGGYHDLPFARATVHGLGASLELIERVPAGDRPDMMALYPSWWGDLPTLFGRRVTEVPVIGNVICGGAEKVIYRANWSALDHAGAPRTLRPGEGVLDELDVADLVSEREHRYELSQRSIGFVEFRVLRDLSDVDRDLFDAGRLIPSGASERARVHAPHGEGRLIVRTVAAHRAEIDVLIDARPLGQLVIEKAPGWAEASIPLPSGLPDSVELTLTPRDGDWVDHHVWVVEAGDPRKD